jgi:hypothetical protein
MAATVSGCAGAGAQTPYGPPLASQWNPNPVPPPRIPILPWTPPEQPRVGQEIAPPPFFIHGREEWATSGPLIGRMDPMGRITKITVHHEGMDAASACSPAQTKADLRTIQRGHEERMHAGDIGYHYYIDYNGRIWEGRDLRWQGAHAGNNDANRGNIGICLAGNFDLQRPTGAQISSLNMLLNYLMRTYHVSASNVYTHREIKRAFGLAGTDCPGKYLQQQVNAIRNRLADSGK